MDAFHPRVPLAAALAALLSSCADLPTVAPIPPEDLRGAVECVVQVRSGAVECAPFHGGAGSMAGNLIFGGQGVNVRLASSSASYDSATQRFGMEVTVQNLLVQTMGTADGLDTAGITVFFASGPAASAGSGSVSVLNADGEGAFTAFGQSFFQYPGTLTMDAVSAPRRWEFSVPHSVQSFSFRVYVRTPLLPVVVFDWLVSGNRDLYRVALDGSDLVRLTTHAADDLSPTVGGRSLVWVSHRNGNAELYARPLAGGAETRLTTTSAGETEPTLTRDGARLAYVSDGVGGVGKVYVASGTATGAARFTASTFGFSGSPEAGPAWDASGSRLALVGTPSGTADIFAAASASGTPLPLVPSLLVGGASSAEVNPAYSPDGTRVAYASNVTGDGDVYLLDVASGVRTRLTTRAGAEANPTWLDDGRIVYLEYHASGEGVLRWIDPGDPSRTGTVPLPGTGRPNRPRVVPGL